MTTLHTLLATYHSTAALKLGAIESPLLRFDFADVKQANTGFKSLVRDQRFDVGELAIVTFLQAKAFGTPYVLMPAVVVGRSQHGCLLFNPARGDLDPRQLAGRRVGVRAYTQTTGAWVRGILEQDFGVDFKRVRWITTEEPHVREYQDPPWVERVTTGKGLEQMLNDGDVDAAIFGNDIPGAPLRPLIPDADKAATDWAGRHGGVPINHMLVVRDSIARAQPEIVREVFRLLLASRDAAGAAASHDGLRYGVESIRATLELIIDYSLHQQLIPRRLTVDELFDDTTRALTRA
jgi:4,5-dihydroxyphthalate decarboxylase